MNASPSIPPIPAEARRSALSSEKQALLQRRLQGRSARATRDPGIPCRREDGPAVLSFAQQRLWFLDQLAPGNAFYNIPSALRFSFPVSAPLMERCVNEIVRRHASLRTTLVSTDGDPAQVVAPELKVAVPVVDLRGLAETEREAEATRRITEEARQPFDLATGPLLRAGLLRLGETDFIFTLTLHHVVADGWSMGIFARELTELYSAFAYGRPSPLEELPIQYPDFAVWQRGWLRGDVLRAQVDYWKRQLADLPVLQLPTDRPRSDVQRYRGATLPMRLPASLVAPLRRLSGAEDATLFMTLMATFLVLLHRHSGQDDVVVGTPIAGRNRRELEGLIGFFVNSLVFRVGFEGEPTFRECLQRVRRVALEAFAHQDLPFETLVDELRPERHLSRNPLFQVTFQLFNAPTAVSPSGAAQVRPVDIQRQTSIFDIAFSLFDGGDDLVGTWEYDTDLFDATTIERMAGQYRLLLEGVAADPDRGVDEYPLIGPAERRRILVEWNQTHRPHPPDATLHRLVEAQVERTPDLPAVEWGDEFLSFAELNARANRLARHLKGLGVGADEVVGVCLERSPDLVIAFLAVLKAGGAYLPLDPAYPKRRLELMVAEARVGVLLTHERLVVRFAPGGALPVCLDRDARSWADTPDENLEGESAPEDAAYVIFTSGSTGRPRGAVVPHRAICNHMLWMQADFPLTPEDRVLQRTATSFDASVWEVWAPLLAGARLVLHPQEDHPDPARLIESLLRREISVLQLVPSLLRILLEEPGLAECRRLRRIFCGGEALSAEVVEALLARLPVAVTNLYGPTECTINSTTFTWSAEGCRGWVPIGRPIANVRNYILDRRGQPVPIGVPGELHIGGACVGRGYLHRPDLTAERFVPDPFQPTTGDPLYRTGDRARYRADGQIEFLGRVDHQVKLRGFRIELGEIEAMLRRHPAVGDAVATVTDDPSHDRRLVAYVVRAREDSSDPNSELEMESWSRQQVRQWRKVYDEVVYEGLEKRSPAQDAKSDFTGWTSSFTGDPIPAGEMREWVDRTVEAIASLNPSRVLEIGCGTGLLLFRLAPHCQEYAALDFSEVAVEYLRNELAAQGAWTQRVRVSHRAAEDLEGVGEGPFDTIILNSVVQYFPNIAYLIRVLDRAMARLAPGGNLFLGDVRLLPLLPCLHTAIQWDKAPSSLAVPELRRRITNAIGRDEELVIDPLFFHALRRRFPNLTAIQTRPKRGRYLNELSRFRTDVILRSEATAGMESGDGIPWRNWPGPQANLDALRQHLVRERPPLVGFRGVPNARLAEAVRRMRELAESGDGDTVAGTRDGSEPSDSDGGGADPEDFWELGRALSYDTDIRWSHAGEPGAFDVLMLRRRDDAEGDGHAALFPVEAVPAKPWSSYANNPMQAAFSQRLVPLLREFLGGNLPEYMVPSAMVLLDALPLTPNGKIDRHALPSPSPDRPELARSFVAPNTPVERVLAGIWAGVLGLRQVGLHDDLFAELGGHSLLATQLASRIRDTFRIELPLRRVFEAPTVAQLAVRLATDPETERRLTRTSELLLAVEGMSDDEVERLLAENDRP